MTRSHVSGYVTNQVKKINPSTLFIGVLISLYFTLFFNRRFLDLVITSRTMNRVSDYLFVGAAILLLLIFINILVSLLGFKRLFKPWLVLLFFTSAAVIYFSDSYGVIIDRNVIQSIFETDTSEATELLSGRLFLYLLVFGAAPSWIVARIPIRFRSARQEVFNKLKIVAVSLVIIAFVALFFYRDFASLFRNHREIRDLIVPNGYVYATYSVAKAKLGSALPKLVPLGEDARLGPDWYVGEKKVFTFLVVGETARAENFSLNGYRRETNAQLKKQAVIYFDHFRSCGTATAVSLPCMFAMDGRKDFDSERQGHEENLLDVIKHAGVPVLWRDNNTGCKGLCDRVDSEKLNQTDDPVVCPGGECYDSVLLNKLEEKLTTYKTGAVIVLHQNGSHGPAYFERVPSDQQRFTPACRSNQLQRCSETEIINAYDNTIAYTDYLLGTLIQFLKQHEEEYDASLIYVSDHGESLGEHGIYLHGLPYIIAPEQQTHIPFLVWFSEGFSQRFQVDKGCLQANRSKPYSHDNLFSSVLGLLDIQTTVYQPEKDLFHECRRQPKFALQDTQILTEK